MLWIIGIIWREWRVDEVTFYLYKQYYDWLDIFFYYNHSIDGKKGSAWVANNQFIYLGSSEDNSFSETIFKYNLKKVKWYNKAQLLSKHISEIKSKL